MSLLRLLTAGKCLVGSGNPETRYHLSRPGALPKFGAKRNPFRATTRPEVAQAAAIVPPSAAGEMPDNATAIAESITPAEEKVPASAGDQVAAAEPVRAEVAAAIDAKPVESRADGVREDARRPRDGATNAKPV